MEKVGKRELACQVRVKVTRPRVDDGVGEAWLISSNPKYCT